MSINKGVAIVIVMIFTIAALTSSPSRVMYRKFVHSLKPSSFEANNYLIETSGDWRFFRVDDVSIDFSRINEDGTRTLVSIFEVTDDLKNPCGNSAIVRSIQGFETSSCVLNDIFEVSELMKFGLIISAQEAGVIGEFLGSVNLFPLDEV